MAFVARVEVRFGDVDYARIIYYPRLLHLLHVAFEDFFAGHVGISYPALIEQRGLGLPAAQIHCDFKAPIRFGDTLSVAFTVPRIGRSSVDIHHRVTVAGPDDLRLEMQMTRVLVDMQTLRPVPFPDDIRRALERA